MIEQDRPHHPPFQRFPLAVDDDGLQARRTARASSSLAIALLVFVKLTR
jgi:hypothetical protein